MSPAKTELLLHGGMALEQLWLTALNLTAQPLESLPIFLAHGNRLSGSRLAETHLARVQHLSEILPVITQMSYRVLLILFRIGQSALAKSTPLRRGVDDVYPI